MLFTRLTWVLAILVLIYGFLSLALGVAIAADLLGDNAEILARYWPTKSTAEMIDRGILSIVLALPLGTLAEIGRSLQR
jgi:hypothetical protein